MIVRLLEEQEDANDVMLWKRASFAGIDIRLTNPQRPARLGKWV